MNVKITKSPFLLLVLSILVFVSCNKDDNNDSKPASSVKLVKDYESTVALDWNELFLDIDRYAPGYRPPAAARVCAYVGLGVYEGLVAGMPEYQSVASNFPGLTIPKAEDGKEYYWPAVANTIYNDMFTEYFPHVSADLKGKIAALNDKHNTEFAAAASSEVYNRSVEYGHKVATAMLDYSKTDDAGHNAYKNPQPTDYIPPTGPGKWQPTRPDYGRALFPYFNKVRGFVVTSDDKVVPQPYPFSSDSLSPFYAQALEVYTVSYGKAKDYTWQWIGEFWSDDIFGLTFEPAARWLAIANQAVVQEKSKLDFSVWVYAKLGIALFDGAIACWTSKFTYNVERPSTYINQYIDPAWNPSLNNPLIGMSGVTPPFPAYPSGHATFGAAGGEVLNDAFSYAYAMTDNCHKFRVEFNGTPRSFDSFDDMAYENALSRVYLGVHYRMDVEAGLKLGKRLGQKVNRLKWRK